VLRETVLPVAAYVLPSVEAVNDPETLQWLARGDEALAAGRYADSAEAYQAALSRLKLPQDEYLHADLSLRVGGALVPLHQYAKAEPMVRAALDFFSRHQAEDRHLAPAEGTLAEILFNTQRVSEALLHQQHNVKLFKEQRGSSDEVTLTQMERLAEMQFQARQYHEAADTFAKVDAAVLDANGRQVLLHSLNPALVDGRFRVGIALRDERDGSRALRALLAAYRYLQLPVQSQEQSGHSSSKTSLLWPEGDSRLGTLLNVLSNLERWALDMESSKEYASLALEANRKTPHAELQTLSSLQLLGEALRDLGKLNEAAPILDQVVALNTQYNGANSPKTGAARVARAENYKEMERIPEAIRELREVLPMLERPRAGQQGAAAEGYTKLAWMLAEQGEFQEAHAAATKAIAITERHNGAESVPAVEAWESDGYVDEHWGRLTDAERSLRHGYDLCARICGPRGVSQLQGAAIELGAVLAQLHRTDEATKLLRKAIVSLEQAVGPDREEIADANWILAQMAYDAGHYAEAEPYARDSYTVRHKTHPQGHNTVLSALLLAMVCMHLGRDAELEDLLREMGPAIQRPGESERFRAVYQQLLERLQARRALQPIGSWGSQ
jgi:tetratricopeptide (TPR) repeat protein